MQHLHDLQNLRDRLRTMPGRLTLNVGPYNVPLFGACDPMVREFADDFVADLLAIVEVRIQELSHEQPRHRTPDLGDGAPCGPAA